MIALLRILFITIYCFFVCFFGSIYCLFTPRNPKNSAIFIRFFGYIINFLGVKIKTNKFNKLKKIQQVIYIANHQSYLDILVVSKIIKPNTLTIGKKSLLFVPFFGLLYWLSGNFTINRNNPVIARKKISNIINEIKKKKFLVGYFQKEQEI